MINEVINGIKPLYKDKIEEAKIRVDSLAKPLQIPMSTAIPEYFYR